MTTDPHPWASTLETLLAQVWSGLIRGVKDRCAPARHPTLATLSPSGWPEARTVVLRAADPASGHIDIHTDLRSGKIAALQACPRAALHIWDSTAHLQTRIEAEVSILSGDGVRHIWAQTPAPSRCSYGVSPAPGTAIREALAYEVRPDVDVFAVLRCRVITIEALHLGQDHRRAP